MNREEMHKELAAKTEKRRIKESEPLDYEALKALNKSEIQRCVTEHPWRDDDLKNAAIAIEHWHWNNADYRIRCFRQDWFIRSVMSKAGILKKLKSQGEAPD